MKKQVESTKRTPEQVKADAVKTVNKSIREKKEAQKDPETTKATPEPTKEKPVPAPYPTTRIAATVKHLKGYKKAGTTVKVKDIIEKADKIYADNGGNPNLKEAKYSANKTIQTMEALGLIECPDRETIVIKNII